MNRKFFFLLFATLIVGIISLFVGVKDISPLDLLRFDNEKIQVFYLSRIPRMMSILCVGMSMSVAGVIMQQVTSNPFVSPSTGSTMDWAKLGVLVAIMLFPSQSVGIKMIISFLFAFGGSLIFMRILKLIKLKDPIFIPLIGIMLGNVVNSITTFFAYQNDLVQNISSWLQGSFAMVLQGRYELLYIGIPLLILAAVFADRFTIASMGSDISKNLGISYNATVNIGLLISSVITSVVVVTIGTIPFVGVIIPNIVRIYRGDNLRENIWEISLVGGMFLLICDILSRLVIYPFEIPISVTVSIIGGVIFLYLLLRRKRYAKAA